MGDLEPATGVVYVTQSPLVGGAERNLINIARGMQGSPWRPFIIAGHKGDFLQAVEDSGVDHRLIRMPSPHKLYPFPFLLAVARVIREVHRRRAAIIHSNDVTAFPVAGLAAYLTRRPCLCQVRFSYPAENLRWHLRWRFDRAIFSSEYMKRYAQATCPELFPDQRCSVIYSSLVAEPQPSAESLTDLRQRLQLPPRPQVVGFFGRLVPDKGVEEYLEVASAILRQNGHHCFLVVGDDRRPGGTYRLEMERRAEALGLGSRCRFLGFRDDVWRLLHLCQVVVMPSREEPLGLVAVEAGAAGRPVLASAVGGLTEIIDPDRTGILAPPGEVAAFVAGLRRLLDSSALCEELGQRAKERVRVRFSLENQTRSLQDLYRMLVSVGRS